jgi:hypothetical protein
LHASGWHKGLIPLCCLATAVPVGTIPDPAATSGMRYYIQTPEGHCRVHPDNMMVHCLSSATGRHPAEVFRLFCNTGLAAGISIEAGHIVHLRNEMTMKYCRLDSMGRQRAVLRCDSLSTLAATPFEYGGNTLTYMGKSFMVNGTKEPIYLSDETPIQLKSAAVIAKQTTPAGVKPWTFVLAKAKIFSGTIYALNSFTPNTTCTTANASAPMVCNSNGPICGTTNERYQIFCNSATDLTSNMSVGETFIVRNMATKMWCQAGSLAISGKAKRSPPPPPPVKVIMRVPGTKQVTDLRVICDIPDVDFATHFTYTGFGFAFGNSTAVDPMAGNSVFFDPANTYGSMFDFLPCECLGLTA